ncbi:MAG: hypothetical protein JWM47_4324, partial [Acidimicrobiales bacterium]|nr:hypothetical protein [Acidimicrobiales bacterium]
MEPLDLAPAAFATSIDGTILRWGPQAVAVYGYEADEVVGLPASLVVPELRGIPLDRLAREVTASGLDRRLPLAIRDADGRTCTLTMTILSERVAASRSIDPITLALLAGIDGPSALVGHDGRVVAANAPWDRAAAAGWPVPLGGAMGRSYAAALRRAAATAATNVELAAGLAAVLDGTAPSFRLEYQCQAD